MDGMSWRARLAKSNINILNIDENRWYYEFMYHPRPGQTKWCKTFYELKDGRDKVNMLTTGTTVMDTTDNIAERLADEVLKLRKELEG